MSFNTFGKIFRFTTWGESHGPAIGCIVDGCPPNIPISEKEIQRSIDLLRGKITVILIAHRISTLKNTDFLYVVNDGKIQEYGKFNDLISNPKSFFSKLVSSQML